jgi:hypothetical protein
MIYSTHRKEIAAADPIKNQCKHPGSASTSPVDKLDVKKN